jgi:hypothetical protein
LISCTVSEPRAVGIHRNPRGGNLVILEIPVKTGLTCSNTNCFDSGER